MAKLLTYDSKPLEINGLSVNVTLPCSAKNYTGASSRSVAFIVIHYTGNENDSARANASYFHNNPGTGASAHYFVDEVSIYESVRPVNRAWHCGTTGTYKHAVCRNNNSIGIEMCTSGNYTVSQKTQENAARLAAWWCLCLGITPDTVDSFVLRHYDATGKICPLQFAGKDNARWTAFKNMIRDILISGNVTAAVSSPDLSPSAPVLPAGTYPAVPFRATVAAKVLNVRAKAGTDSGIVSQLPCGEKVTVLETSPYGWGRIGEDRWLSLAWCTVGDTLKPLLLIAQQTLDGRWGNGAERVKRLKDAGYNPVDVQALVNALKTQGIRASVTAAVLNVRKAPDNTADIMDKLVNGTVVSVLEVQEGPGATAWGRIKNGWISLDYTAVL